MDLHYNAFISYRHHPQDTAVAETIHRSLERFRVPSALKKQGKKIERLFRDKEELPLTSSLTDTITMALENSDYLIVICSTHLKESYWVQREIETFLKTHTKDKVLTVLVDGDNPYDVIPDILTYTELTDPETGEVRREPLEPLSCDWRMPRRKAMREELPRLAAVLLGCSYDELRQRQRQYRTRRLVTALSALVAASVALAAYFLHTSIQIKENLDQALYNQSQYLTTSSQTLLSNGDRLAAISLALEALPDYEGERPYFPAAEYALSEALGLYDASGDLVSVGSLNVGSRIRDFTVTDDGVYAYLFDERGTVSVFDTNTFMPVSSFECGTHLLKMLASADGNLLFLSGGDAGLQCYSPAGALLWQMEGISDMAFYGDKGTLLCIRKTGILTYETLLLDAKSGRKMAGGGPLEPFYKDFSTFSFLSDELVKNQPVAIQASGFNEEYQLLYACGLLDVATGKARSVFHSDSLLDYASVAEDGNLYVMLNHSINSEAGNFFGMVTTQEMFSTLLCYDAATGQERWRSGISTHAYNALHLMDPIPGRDQLLCLQGDMFFLVDKNTGAILAENRALGIPCRVQITADYAWFFAENGMVGLYYYDQNYVTGTQYVSSNVLQVSTRGGYFVHHKNSSSVMILRQASDSNGHPFDFVSDESILSVHNGSPYMLLAHSDFLEMFDMTTQTRLWIAEKDISWRLLGFGEDGTSFYVQTNKALLTLDSLSGELTASVPHPETIDGSAIFLQTDMYFLPSGFYCSANVYGENGAPYIFHYDPSAGTSRILPFLTEEEQQLWAEKAFLVELVYADKDRLLLLTGNGNLYEWNISDSSSVPMMADMNKLPPVTFEPGKGHAAMVTEGEIVLLSKDRSALCTIPTADFSVISMYFHEGYLLALCNDATLRRYDLQGTLVNLCPLTLFRTSSFADICWLMRENGELVLLHGRTCSLIDTQRWLCRYALDGVILYDNVTDTLVTNSDSGVMHAYRLLNTQEVMEIARDTLGSYQLTAEQKSYYGLQ